MRLAVSVEGRNYDLVLERGENAWHCELNGRKIQVDVAAVGCNRLSLLIKGKSYDVLFESGETVIVAERAYTVSVSDPRSWRGRRQSTAGAAGPQKLTASMPGRVVRILANEGAHITPGQGILVIEAMKMQNEIRPPREGKVSKILVQVGANVNAGQALAIIE